MSYTPQELGWLLGGRCGLRANGEVEWRSQNQNYVAQLPLTASGIDDGDAVFTYRIGKLKASEPTLLISFRRVCAYRLDVNGNHRDGEKLHVGVTHIQRRPNSASTYESFHPNPAGVPDVERHRRVTPTQYRQLLAAFAAPIGMDIMDLTWHDPPEGRQP